MSTPTDRPRRKRRSPPESEFSALWAGVLAAPYDEAPRLILADWLADHNRDPELERGLRSRVVLVANLKCKHKRAKARSEAILHAVRQFGRVRLRQNPGKGNQVMYANGGRFKGRITKWGLTESSKKKTEQFYVVFQVLAQIQDGEEVDCPNSEQTIYRPITDNTIDYFVEDLRNLGFVGTDFSLLDPDTPGAHDFAGKEFVAKCKHEEYEGQTRERWEFGWAGGDLSPLDKTGVSKLNQRFGAKLKQAMAGKNGAGAGAGAGAKPAPSSSASDRPKTTAEQLEEVL